VSLTRGSYDYGNCVYFFVCFFLLLSVDAILPGSILIFISIIVGNACVNTLLSSLIYNVILYYLLFNTVMR
jgi:hypothetical protein